MNNLANLIDNMINKFYTVHNDYPVKIIMNKISYNKLIENCNEQKLDNCWLEKKPKNYKGILIEIEEIMEIKLK